MTEPLTIGPPPGRPDQQFALTRSIPQTETLPPLLSGLDTLASAASSGHEGQSKSQVLSPSPNDHSADVAFDETASQHTPYLSRPPELDFRELVEAIQRKHMRLYRSNVCLASLADSRMCQRKRQHGLKE